MLVGIGFSSPCDSHVSPRPSLPPAAGLLESQLSRHDQMLSVHDIRLADMDLRFQVLETASYNGVLIDQKW